MESSSTTYRVIRAISGLIFPVLALFEYDNPEFIKAIVVSFVVGLLFYFLLFPLAIGMIFRADKGN